MIFFFLVEFSVNLFNFSLTFLVLTRGAGIPIFVAETIKPIINQLKSIIMKTYIFAQKNGSGSLILSAESEIDAYDLMIDLVKNSDEWRLDEVQDEGDDTPYNIVL